MRRVGILGASGAVGRTVTELLSEHDIELRLGARQPQRITPPPVNDERLVQTVAVDVTDPAALAQFCSDCDTVVNCSGPSYLVTEMVAAAAVAAGAGYIDAGGDESTCDRLSSGSTPMVLAAGMSPGLSGLLPRWLGEQTQSPVTTLRAWCGGLERFTPAAAADMIASLHDDYGEALAGWREGAVVSRSLSPQVDVSLPPFPGRVTAYPFLTAEARRVARRLGLREAQWYNVFAGPQSLAVLNQLRTQPGADSTEAGQRLALAAQVDLAGRRAYQLMVFEMAHEEGWHTLTLRADDGYRLTAAVTAAAVDAALCDALPPGAHLAADVLDPDAVVAWVRASGVCSVFELTEGAVTAAVEEVVL